MAFVIILYLAIYIYIGAALMTMANKTGVPNGWLGFIPIANLYLMCKIGRKPVWWIILLLIPFVNIVFAILVWMAMATALGHPSWYGVLIIVPLVNFVIPGYLAWATPKQAPPGQYPGSAPYAQPPGGQPGAGRPPAGSQQPPRSR